jgi:hypothetical protein
MKYVCVFLVLVCPHRAWAQDLFALRPLDAWASESLERGRQRSPLVRSLVDRLERSDLIVHIDTREWMASGIAGTTQFVTSVGTHRYVRVSLLRGLSPNARAAMLGHELQHAYELAESQAGTDGSVRELFAMTGQRVGRGEVFETRAAVRAGQRVWTDLRSTSRQEVPSRPDVPSRQGVPSRQDR